MCLKLSHELGSLSFEPQLNLNHIMNHTLSLLLSLFLLIQNSIQTIPLPTIVSLWENSDYILAAWDELLLNHGTALTAVVEGLEWCELNNCTAVGYGQSSDENGESSLDATIYDGFRMRSGSVGNLKLIRRAIRTAYYVLTHTYHAILTGESATDFAVQMGLNRESLASPNSIRDYERWKSNRCQPNYWRSVTPDPKANCGPFWRYEDIFRPPRNDFIFNPACAELLQTPRIPGFDPKARPEPGRDSAGLIVIDQSGYIASGVSTSGRNHRVPGRISDNAVPCAATFAANDAGAAITTGNGDMMLRYAPASVGVAFLEEGYSPAKAAEKVIDRINKVFPNFPSAIVIAGVDGKIGAACAGFVNLTYSVMRGSRDITIETVICKTYEYKATYNST